MCIDGAYGRGGALSDIASQQAKAGEILAARHTFSDAVSAALTIGDSIRRAATLARIASEQSRAGESAEARRTAMSIDNKLRRAQAICAIGSEQAKTVETEGPEYLCRGDPDCDRGR